MNKKLTAVLAATTMVGAIGFTSIASADYNLYGSLRAGAVYSDSDKAGEGAAWDLGATGNDGSIGGQGLYSRIGVMGSTDLGNGSSAGLVIESGITSAFAARHSNVWVGGSWGKLTLGQQDNPYHNARNWDQTWFLGGQDGGDRDGGTRVEGIQYSSHLSGPFQFSIMGTGNDERIAQTACTANNIDPADADAIAACAGGTADTTMYGTSESASSVDRWILNGSLDLGGVGLNWSRNAIQVEDYGYDNTAFGINGSAGGFDWFASYESAKDKVSDNHIKSLGGYVSFSFSDSDKLYFYHVSHIADESADLDETILGYSRSLGEGTTLITEYLTTDNGEIEPSVLALVLKVDF